MSAKSSGPPQAGKPVRRASSFDRFTGRGRKDTAYVLEHANIKKMKKNAARVAKLVKGERQ